MPPPPVVGAVWRNGIIFLTVFSSPQQQQYIVSVIHHWLVLQMNA
jgi:hypothetical protein